MIHDHFPLVERKTNSSVHSPIVLRNYIIYFKTIVFFTKTVTVAQANLTYIREPSEYEIANVSKKHIVDEFLGDIEENNISRDK